ncbi:MAG: ATP-binding cassette domain-containing protein [Burkholderiaceae bacterium]
MSWQIEHLSLSVRGRALMTDLSLHIVPRERWVLLGVNGCGKSTLLRALAGLPLADAIVLQAAQRMFDGKSIASMGLADLARRRAVVAQHADIAPYTLAENLLALAARGNPQPFAHAWNVAHLLAQPWASLSGGERARVLWAACAAQETAAALLDEPFAAMDWGEALLAVDRVIDWGKTVLAVMHDVNLAQRLATHALLFLPGGRWVAGTVDEVFTAPLLSECLAVPLACAQTRTQQGEQQLWHAA